MIRRLFSPARPGDRELRSLHSWWLDLKLGVRMLVKYPGLAFAGGAGIAVAVAIATGGFSFIYANYLAPLPFDEGDRIVSLGIWDSATRDPERRILYEFHTWREELKSVQEISAFRTLLPNLMGVGSRPESVRVAAMTASGFRAVRVRPLLGRYLQDQDERDGVPPVIVIGEDVWRNRFSRDPAILGRTIQLGATRHTIVGVMPKGFAFPFNDHFWVPLNAGSAPPEPLLGPDITVFGKLAPGVSQAAAQAELATLGQRTGQAFPKIYAHLGPQVSTYKGTDEDMKDILVTQGLFISLLVLVCLNVAILVYTRTAMRQAEIGVRTALGASRSRIVTQLFVEAFVLSAVATLVGVSVAALVLREIGIGLLPMASELPFWISFQLSPQAVLYALGLSVIAAAIVGIVPALQATGRNLQAGLRGTGADGMRLGKTWTILIVAQVSFAVALLPPALSSAWADTQNGMAGLGFPAERYLSAQLGMDAAMGATSGVSAREFTRRLAGRETELLRRLQAEPRVSNATFAMRIPGDERGARIQVENTEGAGPELAAQDVKYNRVEPNFFAAFKVPILAGRAFEPADTEVDSTAVVVNQPFAEKMFGGNALGRRIRYVDGASAPVLQTEQPGRWFEIVGIISDFPTGVSPGMRDVNKAKIYHPVAAGVLQPASLAIRMRDGIPATFAQRLREIAADVDPDLHIRDIRGLDEALRSEQWLDRTTAGVFVAITLSVLLLSSAGIYALMSFTVSQRRKEVGIRMALGADWKRIFTSIFSRALLQLAAGVALGMGVGLLIENASDGTILRGNAAVVLPVVALAVGVVGFLAALGPTRRSLRIQPTEALRER